MLNSKTGFPEKKPETIIDINKNINNLITIFGGEGLEIFNKVAHPESIIPTVDLDKKN